MTPNPHIASTQARSLVSKTELDQRWLDWFRNGRTVPTEKSVVDFVREHAGTRPAAIAIQDGDRSIDFATLDRLSNQVANRLLRSWLRPEDIVVIALDRSIAYVATVLGVLKAGGSYLPIDLTIPDQMLLWIVSGNAVARTQGGASAGLVIQRSLFGLRLESLGEATGEPALDSSGPRHRPASARREQAGE